MKNKSKFTILSLLVFNIAFGLQCPNRKAAPPCPQSGVKIIDESYPTQAFVVSNMVKGRFMNKTNKVPEDFAMNVIASYDFENVPQIIFPFTNEVDFKTLKGNIALRLQELKVSQEAQKKILDQLSHANTESYTWQQDYFISQFDNKTGAPALSRFESYDQKFYSAPESTNALSNAGSKCDVKTVESLPTSMDTFGSGEMGGNTQALPGGFCFVGDNQGPSVTEKFCGDKNNVVVANTSWQAVGHVDEIFKVIPTNFVDGRPRECQFSFLAASPRKAIELMEMEKNKSNKTFNFDPKLTGVELTKEKILKSRNSTLCGYLKNVKSKHELDKKNKDDQTVKSVFINLFINEAFAEMDASRSIPDRFDTIEFEDGSLRYNKNCEQGIGEITNAEFVDEFNKDTNTVKINKLVQESIDLDKEKVKKSILSRLPQCAPFFEITDVPDLFVGSNYDIVKDSNGIEKLASPGVVRSLFPNPTNSVVMNKTLLIPDSSNNTFNNYINDELAKKRIKTSYIDVWEFAHVLDGNMHCSSHSLNYCSPKE